MRRSFQLFFAFSAVLFSAAAGPSSLERLIRAPERFHDKELALRGLAHIDGVYFVLYENSKAAFDLINSQGVSVAQRLNGPSYDYLNNRWVTITGVVDAKHHGMWNFPCEVLLESIKDHDGKTPIYRIFRNESSEIAYVSLYGEKTGVLAQFRVFPNKCNSAALSSGTAMVALSGNSTVTRCPLGLSQSSQYFDSKRRAYYYQIRHGQIAFASPLEGSRWVNQWIDGSPKFY